MKLFTQVLAALSKEGLITLEQVMQDGTKIKALASDRSYRHRGDDSRASGAGATTGGGDGRSAGTTRAARKPSKAQARARRVQQERLESALEELQKWQERKSGEEKPSVRRE